MSYYYNEYELEGQITDYSLLHVQLVIPIQQHVSEMEKPFPS